METITVNNNIISRQRFDKDLFYEFVKWLDRSDATTQSYITDLKQFMAYLLYKGVAQPTRDDILGYRQYLLTEHNSIRLDPESITGWSYRTTAAGYYIRVNCKPSTVAKYLRIVCQFFRWTAANGYYPDISANIHAPKVKHDVHRKDALTPREVLSIERNIANQAAIKIEASSASRKDTAGKIERSTEQGKRLYAMYLLAVNAGLRVVELHRANIKDLETKGDMTVLYIWGKGHSEPDQCKPLAPEVAEALKDYLKNRSDTLPGSERPPSNSPLFVSTGNRNKAKRIAKTTISKMLKKAMIDAGYDSERLTAHSLRHTAGTSVQELTDNLYLTQNYMRHSNPATTEIYLHNQTERAEARVAQDLYNYYHGTYDKNS